MEYEDIKDKILGWLREKESFDDKDIYFLFKDLCDETWEEIRGAGETEEIIDEDVVDPDSLEAFGEEPKEEGSEEELPSFDEDELEKEEEDEPEETKETEEKVVKPIYSKKPRVKPL